MTYAERYRAAYKMGHGIKKDLIYAFVNNEKQQQRNDVVDDNREQQPRHNSSVADKKDSKIRNTQKQQNNNTNNHDIVCYRLNKRTGYLETFVCPPSR